MDNPADDIFSEAWELDPGARGEFLDLACAGDSDLRREVERLLTDAERADAFFAATLGECQSPAACRRFSAEKTEDQVGPYRLIEKLGEGGCGVVWMAEQEKPISRRVAVKVIKAGMDTAAVLARFESERQALARMDHPNIARVLDAGATNKGRPYFAMELVDGIPITRFCDEKQLDTKARLALFADVCAAVNHAHQKGVIHRDIKPSNVLISLDGDKPLVKVIDFGIAKAVEGKLTDRTLHTILDRPLGTPAYMSPEQAGLGGQDIDTRSDIYSLGVLLYELLAGVPPFDPKTLLEAGYDEMRRIIREVEPARPSARITTLNANALGPIAQARRVSGDRLPKLIASDLDWIVMKAIEKSRDRRYESADSLARDIGRFVDDKPVEAKPPTTLYLLRKFARRNRAGLRVAVGFLLLLLAATGVSTWLAFRATNAEALAVRRLAETTEERNAKDRALQDAGAVSNFLAEAFRRSNPEIDGRSVTVAQALDAATLKLGADLSGQPERFALLQETLADTYAGLGLYTKSLELQKSVLATRRKCLGVENPATLSAMTRLVSTFSLLGYYQDARDLGEEEVAGRERVDGKAAPATVEAMGVLAKNYFHCGQREKTAELEKEILVRHPPAAKPAPPAPDGSPAQMRRTDAEYHAMVKQKLQEMEQELVRIREKNGPDHRETMEFQRNLALKYYDSGFRAEAVRVQEEFVALQRRKFGEENPATIEEEQALAHYEWRAGQFGKSLPLKQNLIERRRKIFGPEHDETLYAQADLVLDLFHQLKFEDGRMLAGELVPLMRKVMGSTDRRTLNAISNLARCDAATGRTREAIALLEECAPQMRDDTFVNMLLAHLQLWFGLGEKYNETRRWMIGYAKENRDQFRDRPDILERTVMIACLAPLEDEAQGKEILATLERCREIRTATAGPPDPGPGPAWRSLVAGMAYYRIGDYAKAEEALAESGRLMDAWGARFVPLAQKKDKKPRARSLLNLYRAMGMLRQGNTETARELFLDTAKTIKPPPSEEQPLLKCGDASGTPLTVWLAEREARGMLEPSGKKPGP